MRLGEGFMMVGLVCCAEKFGTNLRLNTEERNMAVR